MDTVWRERLAAATDRWADVTTLLRAANCHLEASHSCDDFNKGDASKPYFNGHHKHVQSLGATGLERSLQPFHTSQIFPQAHPQQDELEAGCTTGCCIIQCALQIIIVKQDDNSLLQPCLCSGLLRPERLLP